MSKNKSSFIFNKKNLAAMKPEDKDVWKREKNGFCIRLLPSGIFIWYFIYTFEGRKRYMPLGNYPEVSIDDATTKHADAWKLLKNGKDPLTLAVEAKDERLKAPTVASLAKEYLEKYAMKKKKSWKEDQRILNKDVIPQWGKIKAVDIKKRDVALLLDKVTERGSPVMANRTYALLKKMFSYAIEKDILEFSPCANVRRPNKEESKERVLSNDEIRSLWHNLNRPDIIMTSAIKTALKLILVTGQRPGEVTGMHSKEIKDHWWTIPKERMKKGKRAHRVYLTDLALELIGDLKGRTYIFPSPIKIDRHTKLPVDKPIGEKALTAALRRNIKGQAYRHKIIRKAIKPLPENSNRLDLEHFTPHDLRRTAITLMSECYVPFEHRERVASHSMGKMDETYNQYDFDEPKQIALKTLEKKILEIISPPKRPPYRRTPDGSRVRIIYDGQGNEVGTEPSSPGGSQ